MPVTDTVVSYVRLDDIEPDANQPRKSFDADELAALAESIRENGLLQPILVRAASGGYVIVAGERRWRAHQLLGWDGIDAIVTDLEGDAVDDAALAENMARADLKPIEEAERLRDMRERGLTLREIAAKVGRSTAHVGNRLALLSLTEPLQAMVDDGALGLKAGVAITKLDGASQYQAERALTTQLLPRGAAMSLVRVLEQQEAFSVEQDNEERRAAAARVKDRILRLMDNTTALVNLLDSPQSRALLLEALDGEVELALTRLKVAERELRRVRLAVEGSRALAAAG